ncbi:hypothetical protein GCM10010232_49500 [Streptomyces amakusaensis]|uniref:Helix-turn-helix domain-containing protein n=1 Tax=Streptomyces amakusaensis TaxID=67271 RepID=A0ABW0AKV7_9ACTN
MDQGFDRLAEVMRRVEVLVAETGLDRDAFLNASDLAVRSGLDEDRVRLLMADERIPPAEDFDAEVVRRIRLCQATRLKEEVNEHGQQVRRPYTIAEIAGWAGMTPQWFHKLLRTPKAPNLEHAAALAELFGVRLEFFTAPPALALALVLESEVLPRLESYRVDPFAALSQEFGLSDVAARSGGGGDPRALLGLIHRLSQDRLNP